MGSVDEPIFSMATGSATHNLTVVYDRYGNMTCQVNGSTHGLCPQYSFSSSTNRISSTGYQYGSTGHLINDGTHTYQYDAEGRLLSVDNGTTASYVYNAFGERVGKDVGGTYAEYVFDRSGNPVGENNRSAWTDSWVTFQGRHIAHFINGDSYFTRIRKLRGTVLFLRRWFLSNSNLTG